MIGSITHDNHLITFGRAQLIKQNASKYNKFVVYGSTEWDVYNAAGFPIMVETANSQNKKLIAITGANKFLSTVPYENEVTYEYNPTTFLTVVYCRFYQNMLRMTNYVRLYNNKNFNHTFISLNSRTRAARQEMIDLVYKYDLFEKNIISWNNQLLKLPEINPYSFKYWIPKKLAIDGEDASGVANHSGLDLPKQYFDCFAQLVSETTDQSIFLTEKTAVPLFLKKPFLVATAPGFHKFLTDLGFLLYDEIFDYSFDIIQNRTERFTELLKNFIKLNKLTPGDYTDLYEIISKKLEFNRLRAIEIGKNFLFYSPTMKETIDKQLNTFSLIGDSFYHTLLLYVYPKANHNFYKLHKLYK